MSIATRIPKLLEDLASNLDSAAALVSRSRSAFDSDPAVPLAFEALSNRVGDLCKQLVAADRARFADLNWRLAARNRDMVVHHYARINPDQLWVTVTEDFPQLRNLVSSAASES